MWWTYNERRRGTATSSRKHHIPQKHLLRLGVCRSRCRLTVSEAIHKFAQYAILTRSLQDQTSGALGPCLVCHDDRCRTLFVLHLLFPPATFWFDKCKRCPCRWQRGLALCQLLKRCIPQLLVAIDILEKNTTSYLFKDKPIMNY